MRDARQEFRGAKVMVFIGSDLLALRRDHKPGIAWPGYLDFPGGGREGEESPETCAVRETEEEVGIRLAEAQLTFVHLREGPHGHNWFFAAHLDAGAAGAVRFGDEGEGWLLMPPELFVEAEDAVPHFRAVLRMYLEKKKPDRRTGGP